MKKLFLTLALSAVLAPAMSLAQDAGQIQEVEAPQQMQSKMQEMQADFETQMAELRAEQQAKMNELRAEEQARIVEMNAERNSKIADLQSQLMALETERAGEMSTTGARVVGGMAAPAQSYSLPMGLPSVQGFTAPMVQAPMMMQAPMVQAAPMVEAAPAPVMASPMVEPVPVLPPPPVFTPPAPAFVPAPVVAAPAMPPVLMQVYGPPTVSLVPVKKGCCLFGKCGR